MVDRNKRSGGRGSAFLRGSEGMRRTDDEIAYQKQKAEERRAAGNQPFRFRVPVGETRELIVCDDKPDFFLYEHALKDSDGNWGRLFTGCVKMFDNCPVCEAQGKESYYAMVLTVIDLTPFTLRDGTEVEFSRKLLVVKPAQQKKFLRFYNKEGTLRGALFEMTRDGDKDSSIGNDIEFVEFVDEEEMASYTRSWKDKDGKKHTEDCSEPYVYEDLFEEPTVEKLRAMVGGSPTPGSRDHDERELGGRRGSGRGRGGRDDDRGGREEAGASRGRRRGKPAEDKWEDAEDNPPFDPDERPARRGRGRQEEPEDEPEDTGRRPARRGRGRDEEPEDDPEDKPARGRRGRDEPEDRPARRGRTVDGSARRVRDEEPEGDPEDKPARRGRAEPEDEPEDRPARRGRR